MDPLTRGQDLGGADGGQVLAVLKPAGGVVPPCREMSHGQITCCATMRQGGALHTTSPSAVMGTRMQCLLPQGASGRT